MIQQSAPLWDPAAQATAGAAGAPFMHLLRRIDDGTRARDLSVPAGDWGPDGGGLRLRLAVAAPELLGGPGCRRVDLCGHRCGPLLFLNDHVLKLPFY